MKKSHRYLILFSFILIFLLLVNSLIYNFLSTYKTIIILIVSILIYKKIFGIEKDKHYNDIKISIELTILLLIFFISYYLLGILIGFYKIENYYTIYGLKNFIIPITIRIILIEYLRYGMLRKSISNNLSIIVVYCLFVLLDITNNIYYSNLDTNYNVFKFIALILLPSITNNLLCTYLSLNNSYKISILYLLIITLYKYLIPIIPNVNDFLYSIIFFLMPIIVALKIHKYIEKEMDHFIISDKKTNNTKKIIQYVPVTILVLILIYFTSGYFKYYTVAIASGSMSPYINIGDIAIIEKITYDELNKLEKGQILAYKYNNVMIVHRIIDIKKDNQKYYFYTKGDANDDIDIYPVKEDMIIGIVNTKIPYLGIPTILINKI